MTEELKQAAQAALEALEEIALAGMSGTGQESEEGLRDWHARQAWKFIGIAARELEPLRRALALRPAQQSESKTYSDGTTATGPAPLPEVSPAEQDANLAESLLIDLESMLGQRSGASIKLRSLIRSMRPAQQAVPMTEDEFVDCLVKADCIGVVKMSYGL